MCPACSEALAGGPQAAAPGKQAGNTTYWPPGASPSTLPPAAPRLRSPGRFLCGGSGRWVDGARGPASHQQGPGARGEGQEHPAVCGASPLAAAGWPLWPPSPPTGHPRPRQLPGELGCRPAPRTDTVSRNHPRTRRKGESHPKGLAALALSLRHVLMPSMPRAWPAGDRENGRPPLP